VNLRKRHDLIPSLVETVKGYATHEQETLTDLMEARNRIRDESLSESERLRLESEIGPRMGRLLAVAEEGASSMARSPVDVFVRRPVLAGVVSLFILLLGFRAAFDLPVQHARPARLGRMARGDLLRSVFIFAKNTPRRLASIGRKGGG